MLSKQFTKMLYIILIMMGETTLGSHKILFKQKKAFYICKLIVVFSGRIVRNAKLNFVYMYVKISYFSGTRCFDFLIMLFRPVLIGLGVPFFDTMRATSYSFVRYQIVLVANIEVNEVFTRQRVIIEFKIYRVIPSCHISVLNEMRTTYPSINKTCIIYKNILYNYTIIYGILSCVLLTQELAKLSSWQ